VVVKNFFRKYTHINPDRIDEHAHKFKYLEVDSRLEIAFEGKPKGFQAPSYKVFTNENPNGTVVFNVETRIVQRYITAGCTYKDLEIEPTDFLSTYSGESVDREPVAESTSGQSREQERVPLHRYSTFPRAGEYMVPTNRKVETRAPEYANMQRSFTGKETQSGYIAGDGKVSKDGSSPGSAGGRPQDWRR
jgi:hypothetical protein